jgi:hypothetical protein
MNTMCTAAIYFLVHDVLVLRELIHFENKRFGRIPGFARFLNVASKIFPPTWSARGAVDLSVITVVSYSKTTVGQSWTGAGKVCAGVARRGGRRSTYHSLLPPNGLSLDHTLAPTRAYLQREISADCPNLQATHLSKNVRSKVKGTLSLCETRSHMDRPVARP